jgi:hypothetical protein
MLNLGFNKFSSDIYTEAATLSYELWTQRATIRCTTLREMGRPTFDPKSPEQEPHPSVKHDESDDDHLAGRPITVIVHPLLEAYGTNEEAESEFEGYDKGRVLAPAQVWFNRGSSFNIAVICRVTIEATKVILVAR